MNKNSIKKFIISIFFVVFLVVFFLFGKTIKDNRNVKRISLVKNIVKEKYDKVFYNKDSKYIYTLRKDKDYIYDIFDLHGNKLYSINKKNELNIIQVMKKYYITYDKNYHLFDSNNNEIISGNVIESINEYLIKVDDKIINYDNEILFSNVHELELYNNDKYLNINNYYLVNKKGEIIYENVIVEKEIKNNYITDFLVVKKDRKYYTFFINIDKIIGDGFDYYDVYKNNVLVKNDNTIYRIYRTGLRKKIKTISNRVRNDYYLDNNYLMINKIFSYRKKDGSFGIINLDNYKFKKITDDYIDKIKRIDNSIFIIYTKDINIIYDVNNNKIVYKTKQKLDDIVIFNNKYKTIKNNESYYLYDDKDNQVLKTNKQIIINNKIIIGQIEKEYYLYDIKTKVKKEFHKIDIKNNKYYIHRNKLYDEKYKLKNSSRILLYEKENIIFIKGKQLNIDNLKEGKTYSYDLLRNEEVISFINNAILIESDKYIKIIDNRGNVVKKIKNRKIINYYKTKNGKVIIITCSNGEDGIHYGSYLAE